MGPERATTGSPQALTGLRVVEFSAAMAGPWIGRFLAFCGAEVIRVESRSRPDVVRLYVPPRNPELGTQPQLSPWFTDWNAGKHFVSLDLRQPLAVTLARRLAARSDVVVENYSAGVMDKLGLGYEELARSKPDLIMLSSSGFGATGPCSGNVTWGPNIEALSGMSRLSGFPSRDCTLTQYAHPDAMSALHGLVAVLAALDHRRRGGGGQLIDLSQYDATVAGLGNAMMEQLNLGREPERIGNRSRHAAPHGCYPCRGEDRWCAISVATESEWERFCGVLGRREWLVDPRFASLAARLDHVEELDAEIAARTLDRADYELMNALQEVGVAAGVVQNVEDLARHDEHLASRGFFESVEHAAKGTVTATGIPLGLTGTPGRSGLAGAAPGQDNDFVFGTLLGLSEQEIEEAVEQGAIEPADEPGVQSPRG
jgi:crotonobetainyl-CoA:carnitine CoA-transferase CaiB-like acyl-CoA transferase